ncbi:MAG: benzoyl-CoA reductase, bzd-type, subunit N [Dehalococcoidia bacterium]
MEAFSVVDNRHEYAKKWKEQTGGRVVGVFCSYVPEELIYAAGALPVRVLGSHEPQDVAEPHIFSMFCPFSRDVLAQGLTGKYDYLDGIVHALSCIHLRQAFDSWQTHVPTSYGYFFPMPAHLQSPHAQQHLEFELQEFKGSLEEWTGKPITDTALDEAIEVYNRNRRLMRQVYELRKNTPPLVSGVEAMEMVLASMFMDKREHNQLLERWLEELPQRQNGIEPGIRLMVLGSENDDREVLRLVESLGANVVIDDHCTGSRYFWSEVLPGEDRLAAIASRYIDRPPCPSKDLVERRRFDHVLKLAEDYGVQGAILIQQKFCDPHEFDIPPLKALFEERSIPSLFLEFDMTVPVGQIRTRIEAFLEIMESELF